MDPKVLFEDDAILVVDKPPGMTVNRADTTKGERTLQDWIEERGTGPAAHHLAGAPLVSPDGTERVRASKGSDSRHPFEDFVNRAGIVHRLDKETSGVLVVAKNPDAFVELQKQFKERTTKKTYIALVHGLVKPEEGEINVPVGRLPWNRKRFGIVAEGRESSTHYKALANYTLNANPYTLLELHPRTGRTHQIRVHLKYQGYPIVSDSLYGGRKQSRNDRKILPRLFLHAKELAIRHPGSREVLTFTSTLPSDLKDFLNTCNKPA